MLDATALAPRLSPRARSPLEPPPACPLVFLAEDDAELRRLLCAALRGAGYDVMSAASGHEMLQMLTAASRAELAIPDVIVMDVRMPRCGGLEVLTALRLADWQQPVIMMTAFGDAKLHETATRHGASVSLDKPLDTDDLVDIVDVLLRSSRAAQVSSRPAFSADEADVEPETARCPTGLD